MIRAYFDDYSVITIEINKNFYNGEVKNFELKTFNDVVKLDTKLVKDGECVVLEAKLDFEIEIDESYYIDCEYGYKTDVQYRYITHTSKFDNEYYTDEELGNIYSKSETSFKVWAPTAKKVALNLSGNLYYMEKTGGVFATEIKGDLEHQKYTYLIFVNNEIFETVDPYAISVDENSKHSIIIDKNKIKRLNKSLTLSSTPTIYELSVRYFTASKNNGKFKETFKGLCEADVVNNCGDESGINYLANLGITHVQLMPINQFATVDDIHNDTFNWGYDPEHFLALKPTYSNAKFGIDCINEFVEMVEKFNDKNIGVNVDVVFNHVYDRAKHAFDRVVPYYYYRKDSNGSFCGNDIATERLMVRSYAVNYIDYLVNYLQVDGIRFDLMGLMDKTTLKSIQKSVGDKVMLYGEGWDMPTKLDDSLKSMHKNADSLEGVAFFNDVYRDSFRGKDEITKVKAIDKLTTKELSDLINGKGFVNNYMQSLNYVECHDDHTLYDIIFAQFKDETKTVINFINSILIISKGITFIHSGQEILRTKNGIRNTYCLGYEENNFNWDDITKHNDVVNNVKEYLTLKNQYNLGSAKYYVTLVNDKKMILKTTGIEFDIDIENKTIEYNKTS